VLFPEIIHEGDMLATAYALPDEALREVGFTPAPHVEKTESATTSSA